MRGLHQGNNFLKCWKDQNRGSKITQNLLVESATDHGSPRAQVPGEQGTRVLKLTGGGRLTTAGIGEGNRLRLRKAGRGAP